MPMVGTELRTPEKYPGLLDERIDDWVVWGLSYGILRNHLSQSLFLDFVNQRFCQGRF